jgi:hypothetical protein
MRAPSNRPMTSAELVAAVAAADLGEFMPGRAAEFARAANADYHARLAAFLAPLGFDQLDYLRARRAVKLADLGAEW